MKIVSLNVNGLKSAIRRGWLDWLQEGDWDVVCLQEVKSHPGSLPLLLIEALGFSAVWHPARRPGYSGVAIWSRLPMEHVEYGVGSDEFDLEGRLISAVIDGMRVASVYVPAGYSGGERQTYKERFQQALFEWCEARVREVPAMVVAGDLNVARRDLDVEDPRRASGRSGFLDHERQWLEGWLRNGWVDSFAQLHPDQFDPTWWWRGATAATHLRWRLDYQLVSPALAPCLRAARHWPGVEVSDHCPVSLELASERP